jgi:hypothetical protein
MELTWGLEGVDLVYLAQGNVQYLAVMNAVMNCGVLKEITSVS